MSYMYKCKTLQVRNTICICIDCPYDLKLFGLDDGLSCYIPSTCTAVDCCVDVPLTGRSIAAYAHLDNCKGILDIGIEQFTTAVTLHGYTWGLYTMCILYHIRQFITHPPFIFLTSQYV